VKYFLICTSFLFWSCVSYAEGPTQEKYRSHRVVKGETVYSIAQKYGVTQEAIYTLNPDARSGVNEDKLLIIPSSDLINAGSSEIKFKKHRVRRKETLYSISKKYNVSEDDIKRYNKFLYAKELRKGDRLQIPIGLKPPKETTTTQVVEVSTESKGATHTVLPKETKYGIARKYGISISELESLNPNLAENLPIGAVLNVPESIVVDEAVIEDEKFGFYEVQPKEGFYRLKVKLGLTEDEIVSLNPYAIEGLKAGMILKVPKSAGSVVLSEDTVATTNLENNITNTATKKIALMLPFQLPKFENDSTDIRDEVLKSRRSNAIRVSLDFYSGVLMATQFAKDKGISVDLEVFDTEASSKKVNSILSTSYFDQVDAVIGPLLQRNVERVSSELKSSSTPVFSPLSNRDIKMTSNLFQTLPTNAMLENAMLSFLKEQSEGKHIVVISDAKTAAKKAKLLSALPGATAIMPREKGFLYVVDIDKVMNKTGKENWVILESSDPVLVSNVVGLLNGMPPEYKIRLFTLDKGDVYDFDDISNMHLARLNFTFPSVSKSYDYSKKDAFLVSYKNEYGVLPNKYAVRGFDLTYDILLRLASADDMYDASSTDLETEYVENKFRYSKKMFSGYQNNALYIIKYNENLQFEVVEK